MPLNFSSRKTQNYIIVIILDLFAVTETTRKSRTRQAGQNEFKFGASKTYTIIVKLFVLIPYRNLWLCINSEHATGWMIQNSIPSRNKRFFSSSKHPDQCWDPSSLLFNGYYIRWDREIERCLSPGVKQWVRVLTIHPNLVHGSPTFLWQRPHLLLRASSRVKHGKITVSGMPTCLNYCVIFILHTQFTYVVAGHIIQPGGPWVRHLWPTTKVKNEWSYSSIPPPPKLHCVHRANSQGYTNCQNSIVQDLFK